MRLHSYIVEHDHGFAPNPFFGACTLANCKWQIRKHAVEGDYIVGTGSAKRKRSGYLVFFMRVDRIISFDEFWVSPEFHRKKPNMRGSFAQRYGDNIYFRDPKTHEWSQLDSFHSRPGGVLNVKNRDSDVGHTENVLVATDYAYWGGVGPKIPDELSVFVHERQAHRSFFSLAQIQEFESWVRSFKQSGFIGEPTEWRFLKE